MKIKACGWILLGLLWVGGEGARAQTVHLGIARAGGHLVLSWPATITNGVLQSATNLAAPNWVALSNVVTGTVSNTVAVTNTALAGFFPGAELAPAGIAGPDGRRGEYKQ